MRTNAMIRFPGELIAGKATDTDATPEPCIAFSCTSAMPPPPPPFVMIVRLSALVAVCEVESVTCAVKLLVPDPVGVPEIVPVLGASVNPAGKVPERMDQV